MKYRSNILLLALIFFLTGCSDDLMGIDSAEEPDADVETVEAFLSLSVNKMTVSNGSTRAEDDESGDSGDIDTELETAENRIDDIWVFQFDATPKEDGSHYELIKPAYYTISNQAELSNLKVLLKADTPSIICVVANTKEPDWAKGSGFETYEKLKEKSLSITKFPSMYILRSELTNYDVQRRRSIPMEGEYSEENNIIYEGKTISIPVTRMYAKLVFRYGNILHEMSRLSITITNIPSYCRVKSLSLDSDNDENQANYPLDINWESQDINTEIGEPSMKYIIYIPENLQGIISDITTSKKDSAPPKALNVDFEMEYDGESIHYVVFPGADTTNDYNVKRNTVYNITINIISPDAIESSPSSNCFVVKPGRTLAFEPYNRVETGGVENDNDPNDTFVFKNYLNPEKNEDGTYKYPEKTIDHVKIIWQTLDAIGKNSETATGNPREGDLVTFEPNETLPLHSKIRVKTSKEGNALIGAYNKDGILLWSWHIWITNNNPGNVGNAITYTTYKWDSNGIHTDQRVKGYAVMPCNIGALANSPEETYDPSINSTSEYCLQYRTFGTIFQWGRKDPFPPMKCKTKNSNYYPYDNKKANIYVYNNENELIIMSTDGSEESSKLYPDEVFKTKLSTGIGSTINDGILYSIQNPTVFIAGAPKFPNTSNYSYGRYYVTRGDWLPEAEERLWGAIKRYEGMTMYYINKASSWSIWDNYGTEKTIFDPCPSGWRVPPGDLWLGFTKNGANSNCSNETALRTNVNVPPQYNLNYITNNDGYWICLTGWQDEDPNTHSFFPTQGSRLASGQPILPRTCGNYHNATTDVTVLRDGVFMDRVNILHLHSQSGGQKINTFEDGQAYQVKSVAGPVRCVRDRK